MSQETTTECGERHFSGWYDVQLSGTTGWNAMGVIVMVRTALLAVFLLTVSACGGSAAEAPSGFINEPATTVAVATTATPTTTSAPIETTVAPTTTAASAPTTNRFGIEHRPDWVDESLLVLSEPGTIEAEVETAAVRYAAATREALLAGDPEHPALLATTLGPPQDGVRASTQDIIRDFNGRGEVVLPDDQHPDSDRAGLTQDLVLSIEAADGVAVFQVETCYVLADYLVDADGEVLDDLIETQLWRDTFNRNEEGWRPTASVELGRWSGVDGCGRPE